MRIQFKLTEGFGPNENYYCLIAFSSEIYDTSPRATFHRNLGIDNAIAFSKMICESFKKDNEVSLTVEAD